MDISILLSKCTVDELRTLKSIIERLLKTKLSGKENIQKLNLSIRAKNVLLNNGIKSLEDLSKITMKEALHFRNMGFKSLNEITELLSSNGLKWKE